MKSHRHTIFGLGLFFATWVGFFAVSPLQADPMTGGNVPYEDCAPPCATSPYCPPPRMPWYAMADAVGLRRDRYGSTTFATLGNSTDVALSTSELDRDFRAGAKLTIGHTFGDSPYSLEGSYFAVDQWNASAMFADTHTNDLGTVGYLFSPFSNFGDPTPSVGFDYNRLVSVQDFSQLRNGELNVKYLVPMLSNGFRASLMLGVRYVSVEERFLYHAESVEPVAGGGSTVDLATRTANDLIGPQIGGYFEFFSYANSWISFETKGAICGNNAMQASSGTRSAIAGQPPFSYDAAATHIATSFVGDLELMFNWRITDRFVTRFGYQAMWVTGLALATDNLGPDYGIPPGGLVGINTSGSVVYHGPHLGVEFMW
jgi:hypothetical protein